MQYQGNNPYPKPMVEQPNLNYAHLLLEDFAGPVSEFTAVDLYIFQSVTQDKTWQEYAKLLHHIAEVEMHHMQLLAETIYLLGLNPIYGTWDQSTATYIPWSGANVNYTTDVKQALIIDINSETEAIHTYKRHRSMIQDRYIKQLLTRIIEDEELHLSLFQQFYQSLS